MLVVRPSGVGDAATVSGFTLIEVLVAVAILGISLALLLSGFSTSLERMRQTRAETLALALAQSLLDRIGPEIPLERGKKKGTSKDGEQRWYIDIEDYGSPADLDAWPAPVFDVAVGVSIISDSEPHSLELRTLKIGRERP